MPMICLFQKHTSQHRKTQKNNSFDIDCWICIGVFYAHEMMDTHIDHDSQTLSEALGDLVVQEYGWSNNDDNLSMDVETSPDKDDDLTKMLNMSELNVIATTSDRLISTLGTFQQQLPYLEEICTNMATEESKIRDTVKKLNAKDKLLPPRSKGKMFCRGYAKIHNYRLDRVGSTETISLGTLGTFVEDSSGASGSSGHGQDPTIAPAPAAQNAAQHVAQNMAQSISSDGGTVLAHTIKSETTESPGESGCNKRKYTDTKGIRVVSSKKQRYNS